MKTRKIKGLVALLSIIFFVSCFASKKTRFNSVYKLHDYGNIKSIKQSNKRFYFRYSIPNEQIGIWSDDSIHYFGEVFCYTARKDKKKMKYYGINFHITDSITNEIVKEFNNLHVSQILTKDSGHFPLTTCDDCGFTEYEYSNGKTYTIKTFYFNTGNKVIDSFGNFIEKSVQVEKKFYEFIDYLPYGLYQRNMMDVVKSRH